MNRERPVNLDFTKFKFPPMAFLSVTHRISGMIIFLFLPLFIYMLHASVISQASFTHLQQVVMHNGWMRLAVWIAVSATLYHFLSGLRHMMMDLGFGESIEAGRISAYTVFILGFIVIVLVGVWVW